MKWWAERRAEFPRLSRLALDILAIPACRPTARVTSSARLAITSQRPHLQDVTIEMIQLLRNWVQGKAFKIGNIEV